MVNPVPVTDVVDTGVGIIIIILIRPQDLPGNHMTPQLAWQAGSEGRKEDKLIKRSDLVKKCFKFISLNDYLLVHTLF